MRQGAGTGPVPEGPASAGTLMEQRIVNLVKREGPLTGSEISEALGGDLLLLWRTCRLSTRLSLRTTCRRYLRLDRRIRGFARLSPSILREFLTYSVIGLKGDEKALARRIREIRLHIEDVTRVKSELAYTVFSSVVDRVGTRELIKDHACIIIAGDIVHNMAHDVPRPERSTGKLIKGSDMDVVVIVDDLFPEPEMKRLDQTIYREKQDILMAPHLREEIDYIVKDMGRVREQTRFATFRHMVACKILQEGTLLYGSEVLFSAIKDMLKREGITEKLNDLEQRARRFRRGAEEHLLRDKPEKIGDEYQHLFYPSEESEEFE